MRKRSVASSWLTTCSAVHVVFACAGTCSALIPILKFITTKITQRSGKSRRVSTVSISAHKSPRSPQVLAIPQIALPSFVQLPMSRPDLVDSVAAGIYMCSGACCIAVRVNFASAPPIV